MILSPAAYAVLKGAELYPWQVEALEAVGMGWPTSLVTCNGAGKTAEVAARAVEWFFAKHPRGKLVATSGSFNQLQNQLWPALKARLPQEYRVTSGSSPCMIRTPQGGQGVGFATNDARRAEGWHPTVSPEVDPVFVLVDEGKAVPDEIFVAFDRCTVRYQLYISSPGPPRGRFYDTHHRLAGMYFNRKVSSFDCPHISAVKRERDKVVLGEDSPEYRSMHLAEFTELESACVLSAGRLRAALDAQPEANRYGERVAFFDFAAGGDENVFALREGNSVRVVDAWRDSNTVQAVRRFMARARELSVRPHECWGDADGLGLPMVQQFHDEGFAINSFRGGYPAAEREEYSNLISEVWIQGSRKIERGQVHLGELDSVSFTQLTGRFLQWDERGRLRVERKADMARRGVGSPDRADALLGALMCGPHMAGSLTGGAVDAGSMAESDFRVNAVRF